MRRKRKGRGGEDSNFTTRDSQADFSSPSQSNDLLAFC